MATAAEIRNRAANDLGILRLGQSLQYQDQVRVDEAYDEVYDQLKNRGLTLWAEADEVPDEFVPHVVALVAENAMNTFSVSDSRATRIIRAANIARREIPFLATPEYESMEEPTDY